MAERVKIPRPQRWQTSFGPDMDDAQVRRILTLPPFVSMDPERFPAPLTLDGVVRHDTRLLHFEDGDLVVRAGDYGNSAFLVVAGELRVILPPGLPGKMLGRSPERRQGWLEAVGQLWRNSREPEARDAGRYAEGGLGTRDAGPQTRIFLQDLPAMIERDQTYCLAAGEIFGEIAALGRTQRVATVIAQGEVELLEIRWQGLREIRRRDAAFRAHVENLYRERSLETHLRETPILRDLPPELIAEIADQTLFETYGEFDWYGTYKRFAQDPAEVRLQREPVIVAEGAYPDGLLLIRSGFGRVSRRFNNGHKTLRYLGRGGVFGMEELLRGWQTGTTVPLDASLRAVGYTDVLRVPTAIIEQHVLPRLDAREVAEIQRTLTSINLRDERDPEITHVAADASGLESAMLEMLVDHHFINGTSAMLINLDRCVRCDACVDACAVAHDDNPRFNRHGPRYGPITVANACMHCADPVCMIGCPTGAIHRSSDGGQVLINDDTCIGCATCADSCPYDNIRMVEVRDASGQFIVDQAQGAPIRKATKCDLCIDQPSGPACEAACPHDALVRMDLRDLPALADWLQR